MSQTPRLNGPQLMPEGMQAMLQLEGVIAKHLDAKLVHLVKLRASQINGCAYCIAMHTREAQGDGEPVERLTMLDAWEESSLYSDRERAALAWTDAVTRIADTHAPQEDFDRLREHFDDAEIAHLTLAIATINAWNRIAIATRAPHD